MIGSQQNYQQFNEISSKRNRRICAWSVHIWNNQPCSVIMIIPLFWSENICSLSWHPFALPINASKAQFKLFLHFSIPQCLFFLELILPNCDAWSAGRGKYRERGIEKAWLCVWNPLEQSLHVDYIWANIELCSFEFWTFNHFTQITWIDTFRPEWRIFTLEAVSQMDWCAHFLCVKWSIHSKIWCLSIQQKIETHAKAATHQICMRRSRIEWIKLIICRWCGCWEGNRK